MDSEDEAEVAAAAAAGGLPPMPAGVGGLPPVVPGVPTSAPLPPVAPLATVGKPDEGDVKPADGGKGGEGKPAEGGGDEEEGGDEGGAKVGEFLVKETGATCKAVFLPEGTRFNSQKLQDLAAYWKIPADKIGVLLSCDGGTVHPKQFAAMPLAKLPSFAQFWKDAQQHAEKAGKPADQVESFALEVIRKVIWVKLCTIFSAILDSAEVAGNWIVIDRINAKSPAGDLLVESALAQTSARPTILVLDSLKRLGNFKGPTGDGPLNEDTASCKKKLTDVRDKAIMFGVDGDPGLVVINRFYDVSDFMDPEKDEFVNGELPRPAEPAHINMDLPPPHIPPRVLWQYHYLKSFFASGSHYIVVENNDDAPDLSGLGPFGYVYANGQALMFPRLKVRIQSGDPLVMLHNTGGVVQAFASLREAMLSQYPVPSPSELLDAIEIVSPQPWTKQFGLPEVLMMQELNQRAPMLLKTSCVSVDVMRDNSEMVLSTLTCCFSGGNGVPELGLGEAEMLCIITAWKRHRILWENAIQYEKYADAIQFVLYTLGILTTLIAIAGPLILGIEFTPAMTEAFAQMALDSGLNMDAALGIDPAADADVGSGSGESGSGSGEASSGPDGDGLGTPTAADEGPPPPMTPIDYVMVGMPLAMTFLGTLRTKLRPREKWSTCLMASMQIVQQIYYYRLRTDRYDTAAPLPPPEDGEEVVPISPKMREVNARKQFVDTCGQIYSHAISTEVSKGGALKIGTMAKFQTHKRPEQEQFILRLNQHVQNNLYKRPVVRGRQKPASSKPKKSMLGGKKQNKVAAAFQDAVDAAGDAMGDAMDSAKSAAADAMTDANAPSAPIKLAKGDDLGADKSGGSDDLTAQLAIESYIENRVRAYVDYFEYRAPLMAKRTLMIDAVQMLASSASAVLGVIQLSAWAPVTVALSSVALALMDYFYVPSQLAAANRALEECHNLLIAWDSWSLVQRKMRVNKLKCATTLEGAVLSLVQARTGVDARLPSEQGGGGDEEE